MTDEPPVDEASPAPAKKAAKKAPAKKAPAKKAAAKKAPAKKAAAKKAPAKKAAAKKAAAKKAGAGRPRTTILNRIQELEERIAADGPLPPPEPARPRRAAAAPTPAPEPAPEPVAEPEPEPKPKPVRRQPAPAAQAAPAPEPVVETVAVEPVAQPTQVVRVSRADASAVRVNRVLAGLTVLLLALAAALGAAALAKSRPATWRAEQAVDLVAPSSPGTEEESAVVERLRKKAESAGFAGLTAAAAGVSSRQVRELFKTRVGDHQVVLVIRTAGREAATRLADAAGRQLLLDVNADQSKVTDPNRRFGAQVTTPATKPVKEKPTHGQEWLAGVLAGLAVLLVGAVAIAFMTTSPRRD